MKKWISLLLVFWVGWVFALDVKTYIPEKAPALFPMIKKEAAASWPDIPELNKVPALMEQESCISLTHRRCMDPTAELNTSREYGVGLGQTTKAFNKDGSIRFDTLLEMRRLHEDALKELSWGNIKTRPDLQIRFIFLKLRDNFKQIPPTVDRHNAQIFAFSAYNQGSGAVNKDRLECRLTKGCNPNVWFDNVEKHCTRSKTPIYGNRTACTITREHTYNVFKVRWMKYEPYFRD